MGLFKFERYDGYENLILLVEAKNIKEAMDEVAKEEFFNWSWEKGGVNLSSRKWHNMECRWNIHKLTKADEGKKILLKIQYFNE